MDGVVPLAAVVPVTRPFFHDSRFAGRSAGELSATTLFRIPLGTVAPEELLFRGVLFGYMLRRASPLRAAAASSALFGLWHVLPSLDSLKANRVGVRAEGLAPTIGAVAGTVAVTGMAGLALSWARLHGGHLVAPTLIHWSLNATAAVAAWLVVRARDDSGDDDFASGDR